jgi:hypothetical protein
MRKEGEGIFHSSKKNPSGSEINKGIVTLPKERTKSIEQTTVEEKYNITPESVHPEGARLLHPNRNTQNNSCLFIHDERKNDSGTVKRCCFKTLTIGGFVHVLNEDHNAPGQMAVLRY